MSHKDGNIANQIISLQKADGTWGQSFHSLSVPTARYPLTTEQALRRLWALGFTINDPAIRITVDCMVSCLKGERKIDDYWEKTHDWVLFTQMMLSAWVKIFEPDNEHALSHAKRWAAVIEKSYRHRFYDPDGYKAAYANEFASITRGAREIDPTSFYHMVLLQGVLSMETENRMLDYVISKPDGIYYIYNKAINVLPESFASIQSSRYVAALEILSGFDRAGDKLGFAADWLNANKDADGQWDFGSKANDGVYFPLSDSWRKTEDRKADCTERVTALLSKFIAKHPKTRKD